MNKELLIYVDDYIVTKYGIPSHLFLQLLSHLKTSSFVVFIYVDCNNEKVQSFILNTLLNFINFNNLQYKIIIKKDLTNPEIINLKNNNLFFTNRFTLKNLSLSDSIVKFVSEYEGVLGKLPFYTKENQILEKIKFINDCVLGLSSDIVTH